MLPVSIQNVSSERASEPPGLIQWNKAKLMIATRTEAPAILRHTRALGRDFKRENKAISDATKKLWVTIVDWDQRSKLDPKSDRNPKPHAEPLTNTKLAYIQATTAISEYDLELDNRECFVM